MMSPDEIRTFIKDHNVQIRPKSASRLMRIIAWFCSIRWFWWRAINPHFMDKYTTTIARTIYYRAAWEPFKLDDDATLKHHATTMEHEFVHVRQYEKWRWLFLISYVLFPLPIGLAWFRWRFEREAYLVNMRAGRSVAHCVEALWQYGWPWPRAWMHRWFTTKHE